MTRHATQRRSHTPAPAIFRTASRVTAIGRSIFTMGAGADAAWGAAAPHAAQNRASSDMAAPHEEQNIASASPERAEDSVHSAQAQSGGFDIRRSVLALLFVWASAALAGSLETELAQF